MKTKHFIEFHWTDAQRAQFRENGFVVVERVIEPAFAEALIARYSGLFAGRFETGRDPDNMPTPFAEGDLTPVTRWISNPWMCDYTIANFALAPQLGRHIATLNGWSGVRLLQDNIHWKPPRAPELALHQDSSYHLWCVPSDICTCWVALADTTADGGTLMLARGSHGWPRTRIGEQEDRVAKIGLKGFLDPTDYQGQVMAAAAAAGVEAEFVNVELPAGGGVFFGGWMWHGSDANRSDRHRYSISAHGQRPETRFHPTLSANVYDRYRDRGEDTMDEAGFPVLWSEDGYRSDFLDVYMRQGSGSRIAT